MMKPVIHKIPIEQLYYDFEFIHGGDTQKYRSMFFTLEKTLPNVPKQYVSLVNSRFPLLGKVYRSIEKEGLVNPLIVLQLEDRVYRVRVGNQRLVSLRATGYSGKVPCYITPDRPKTIEGLIRDDLVPIPGIDRSSHVES